MKNKINENTAGSDGGLYAQTRLANILLDAIPIPVFFKDEHGVYRGCNGAFERYLGRPADEIIGKTAYDVAPPALAKVYEEADRHLLEVQGVQTYESTVHGADGSPRDVVFYKSTFADEQQGLRGVVGTIFDITERNQLARDRQQSDERFQSFFEMAAVGMATATPDGLLLQANKAFADFIGCDRKALEQCRLDSLIQAEQQEKVARLLAEGAAGLHHVSHCEKRFVRKDGASAWGKVTLTWLQDANGQPLHCIVLVQDITGHKAAQQEIHLLSYHDALTDLPNRAFLKDRLEQLLGRAYRDGRQIAVLHIDLDRFKKINDSMGHAAGDQLLVHMGQRLKVAAGSDNLVTRSGGDAFVVVCPGVAGEAEVTVQARRILDAVAAPFEVNGQEVFLSASIGIAMAPLDGTEVDELLRHADTAMHAAKGLGRDMFQFYCLGMNQQSIDRLILESGLRRALQQESLFLVYHPQLDLKRGVVTGMEALVRWEHPAKGMISPAEFIPIAEEVGLILPLGEWVLRTACTQAKAWQDAGHPTLRVAVNISGTQFKQPDFIAMVDRVLAETGLPADCLELELTESVLMEKVDVAIRTLTALKMRGIHLSIDDFGTGYSSLSYLKHFPIDRVKIAQSFVCDVTTDPDNRAIIDAIISLAKSLGLQLIAEGVETAEQLSFLSERGCHQVQGFYFSRPLCVREFGRLLDNGLACAFPRQQEPAPVVELRAVSW